MGASGWVYEVDYQPDLADALERLRRKVFDDGSYVSPVTVGLPAPASLDDLISEPYWEFLGESGTHSVLDIAAGLEPADNPHQGFGTVRPLTEAETLALFGADRPEQADYEAVGEADLFGYVDAGRYTGRAAILWDAGAPRSIVFWGYSGD
jgi:hypothetical protein